MKRRDWFKSTFAGAMALAGRGPASASPQSAAQTPVAAPTAAGLPHNPEIYKLLGFATMTGEAPATLWARLKETREWLAGPLAPDAWAGQVFIADHADIFAFRFLSIPAYWLRDYQSGSRPAFAAERFAKWFANWPAWWRTVGPKAPDNSYARLVWQMPDGGPEVTYEWAQTGKSEIVCRIQNSAPADMLLQAYVPWDNAPPAYAVLYSESPDRRFLRGRSWVPGTRDGMRWVLALSQAVDDSVGIGTGSYHACIRNVKTLYLCGRQGQAYEELEASAGAQLAPGKIDELLDSNRQRYLQLRPEGAGWLADVPAAINDQLQWSEVYTPERKRSYITVSRAWAHENNSAPDFLWDSFFSALLVCQEDERKSFALVRDISSWQNEQGMFCQYGQWVPRPNNWIFPVAWGHTQYPVAALATAKIYLRRPNKKFLAEVYPRLLKAHQWWFRDRGDGQPWRDGNRDGLLELGSNYPEEIPYEHRQQTAYFESHDDSPEWWHVAPYNEKTNTIELDTVERNCLYTMDAWVLSWMARELGRTAEAADLAREHDVMAERINRLLWDSARNTYANRRWQPREGNWFNPQIAPDIFLSLLGKVAPPDHAEALRKIFHDPHKFAGEWILPTISRDDPMYPKQHYWRGKVWAPINWLVYQGLKIYEWDHEARLLAESSAKMFLRPWRERAECYENFLSTTGEGSSDPHYTWGAMMVLIALEEIVDINPWHGLRFGNTEPVEEAGIRRYYVAGSLYDVWLSPQRLEVHRDGAFLFGADAPIEIRQVSFGDKRVTFEVRTTRPVNVRAGRSAAQQFPAGIHKAEAQL
jgi:Glycosyl hydrolase family 63 C-terminal domain